MFSFGNALKAQNVDDIALFFKTSSIIQQDLVNVKGVSFCLVLRKWINIHPAAEFRCIVVNNVLRGTNVWNTCKFYLFIYIYIGITPRDWPTFYAHFKEEGAGIIETLLRFFGEHIKGKFPRKHCRFYHLFCF